ncbi:hypothetical protein C8J56DRAFT_895746 [Mycena floridula]|nr:hypothetical protein C8J56DRAFT_895746 [Mycena floridula]
MTIDTPGLVETLSRVIQVTEESILANTELTNVLREILAQQAPSSAPEPPQRHSFAPLRVGSPRKEIPWRWKYGPEIPTPQAIEMQVKGFPEGPLYVVTVGTAVGVFATWALASPYVTGVSCNSHKSVASRRAAIDFWTSAYNDVALQPAIRIVPSANVSM